MATFLHRAHPEVGRRRSRTCAGHVPSQAGTGRAATACASGVPRGAWRERLHQRTRPRTWTILSALTKSGSRRRSQRTKSVEGTPLRGRNRGGRAAARRGHSGTLRRHRLLPVEGPRKTPSHVKNGSGERTSAPPGLVTSAEGSSAQDTPPRTLGSRMRQQRQRGEGGAVTRMASSSSRICMSRPARTRT